MHYDHWNAFMGLHMVFWLVLLIVVAVALVRLLWPARRGEDSALEILEKRYARGEIDHDEFERLKQELHH